MVVSCVTNPSAYESEMFAVNLDQKLLSEAAIVASGAVTTFSPFRSSDLSQFI